MPPIIRSLKHRNFRLFFAGQLISLIGTWMQAVAQSWLIYRLTHSAFLLGMVAFTNQFPSFFLSPLGGVVADRYNRQRIIIVTQISSMLLALILAALTLTHVVENWHIFVLAALLGFVNAFDVPARQSFVVEMVGREDLMNALALNSSMVNGARIIGPAIAGIVVAGIGEGWCFFANGVSYIAVIAGLLMMKLPARAIEPHRSSAVDHMMEGFMFIVHNVPIRVLLFVVGIISLFGLAYMTLMPIFADEIFQRGARGLGILMGAAGVGAMIGALMIAARKSVRGIGKWISMSCFIFGISLIAFAQSRNFWMAVFFLIPTGGAMMIEISATNTLLQTMVPDNFRGRVMSAYAMMVLGMAPFGALVAGAIAKPFGAPFAVSLGGIAIVIVAFFFSKRLPGLRDEIRKYFADHHIAIE